MISPPPNLSRRAVLAAAATAITPAPLSQWANTLGDRSAALGRPGLLPSYATQGNSPFDRTHATCAYTYDNAAAGLALLASGNREAARRIADALVLAQSHDRAYADGRLRNAYRAGPAPTTGPYPLNGWWDAAAGRWLEDPYQAATATGPLAWVILLWAQLGDPYRAAANRAADFIEDNVRARNGFSGGFQGFEPHPEKLRWVSTEHNVDLCAAFAMLGRADAAQHAANFVASMWQKDRKTFAMGLHPDGTLNPDSALDANLWPLLLPGAHPDWRAAFATTLRNHAVGDSGVDFNTDRDGVWLEGNAYIALLAQRLNKPALAASMLQTLHANTAPDGMIYATSAQSLTTGLSTGNDPFLYYRRPALAPTAWSILAIRNVSPFGEPQHQE